MAYSGYEMTLGKLYLQSGSTEDTVFHVRPGHGLGLAEDTWTINTLSV